MVIYVPGTEETDQKKQNMSLQQLGSAVTTNTASIAAMQAAWTSYTPIVTALTGTITASSATGRYNTIGKTVFVQISVVITTAGTGQYPHATLPFAASGSSGVTILTGRESAINGKMLQGVISTSGAFVEIINYDNSNPALNGVLLSVSGVYESA